MPFKHALRAGPGIWIGEELRSKPMYREPFKMRRCIVPATGYIEFSGSKGDKTAHLFNPH